MIVADTARCDIQANEAGPLALEAAPGVGRSDGGAHGNGHVSALLIKSEPAEGYFPVRRGGDHGRAVCDTLTPMASSSLGSDAASDKSATSPDGLSAFVARVLDQLSLSSWLPAAFLTAGTALILEFRKAKSASILNAVAALAAHPIPVLVMIVPLLVIATVITQAFSFGAIRFLEGYWGGGRGPISFVAKLMIRKHHHKKNAVLERAHKESVRAFRAALPEIVSDSKEGISGAVVRAIEANLAGRSSDTSSLQGNEAQALVETIQNWRNRADAWQLARIDRLVAQYKSYPVDSRLLPTRLGNFIRATEDSMTNTGGDVRGFVLRQHDKASVRVQLHHDQFRTRLDMYCTLVFVSAFLAIIAPIALTGRVSIAATAIATGTMTIMGVVSYLAALASAGGYCMALKRIDEAASETAGR